MAASSGVPATVPPGESMSRNTALMSSRCPASRRAAPISSESVPNSHYLTAKAQRAQREIVYRENPALLCVSLRPLRLCGKSSGCSELLGLCRRAAEVECLGAFSKNKTQAKRTATAKDALHFLWEYLGWTGGKRPVALGLVGPLHAEFKTYRQIADRMCRRFDSRFPCGYG